MSRKYGFSKEVFGFAQPARPHNPGRIASVFHGAIKHMARHGPLRGPTSETEATLLGHIMAHELGHLLLGTASHSERGIMSFPWGATEMIAAQQTRLGFSSEQRFRIHHGLAAQSENP